MRVHVMIVLFFWWSTNPGTIALARNNATTIGILHVFSNDGLITCTNQTLRIKMIDCGSGITLKTTLRPVTSSILQSHQATSHLNAVDNGIIDEYIICDMNTMTAISNYNQDFIRIQLCCHSEDASMFYLLEQKVRLWCHCSYNSFWDIVRNWVNLHL